MSQLPWKNQTILDPFKGSDRGPDAYRRVFECPINAPIEDVSAWASTNPNISGNLLSAQWDSATLLNSGSGLPVSVASSSPGRPAGLPADNYLVWVSPNLVYDVHADVGLGINVIYAIGLTGRKLFAGRFAYQQDISIANSEGWAEVTAQPPDLPARFDEFGPDGSVAASFGGFWTGRADRPGGTDRPYIVKSTRVAADAFQIEALSRHDTGARYTRAVKTVAGPFITSALWVVGTAAGNASITVTDAGGGSQQITLKPPVASQFVDRIVPLAVSRVTASNNCTVYALIR